MKMRVLVGHLHILSEFSLYVCVFRNRAAMFVANHNSWMDIPFMGYTMGWRNYKLISKAELGKVPILGKSIKEGGHVMIDRSNRKSQLQTFKAGVQWLLVSCATY
jgi:1-acyl-sn-glycerol-3-phosphate acyltransferase